VSPVPLQCTLAETAWDSNPLNAQSDGDSVACDDAEELAGRQGFELGAGPVSNMVMARDFWFQALESQAVTSLRVVHCRPPESSRFCPRRGDILETTSANLLVHRRSEIGQAAQPWICRSRAL
jgi:hypothetical protein